MSESFGPEVRAAFETFLRQSDASHFHLPFDQWVEICQMIQNPDSFQNLDKDGQREKWTALNEYVLDEQGTLFKLPTIKQLSSGMGQRKVVLEHEVYEIIYNMHIGLIHAGGDKTFKTINKQYYGIRRDEVCEIKLYDIYELTKYRLNGV